MVKKKLVIVGAGGLGRELFALVRCFPMWQVEGFYDDNVAHGKGVTHDVYCLGSLQELKEVREATNALVGIGDPVAKKRVVDYLSGNQLISFPSFIHPAAVIGDPGSVEIGQGTVVAAHVSITTNVVLEDHVLINLNATIGHDSLVGRFSSVMPGVNISGSVSIGDTVLIGSGAIILNGLKIGPGAIVGAGAVVTRDVQKAIRVKGIPARPY